MEDDLNKIFAEFERQGIEVTIFARTKNKPIGSILAAYEVTVNLSLGDRTSSNTSAINVSGVGTTYRNALSDAFFRIEQMRDILGWRPSQPEPTTDDDIPF